MISLKPALEEHFGQVILGSAPSFCSGFSFIVQRYNRALTATRSILKVGQELSVKPLACLVPTAPTAHGGSKEDLLAMNDTARRAGLYMRSSKDCVCYAKSKEEIC